MEMKGWEERKKQEGRDELKDTNGEDETGRDKIKAIQTNEKRKRIIRNGKTNNENY